MRATAVEEAVMGLSVHKGLRTVNWVTSNGR
jgi:hypothetical protein